VLSFSVTLKRKLESDNVFATKVVSGKSLPISENVEDSKACSARPTQASTPAAPDSSAAEPSRG
jgi:hypothetical protein